MTQKTYMYLGLWTLALVWASPYTIRMDKIVGFILLQIAALSFVAPIWAAGEMQPLTKNDKKFMQSMDIRCESSGIFDGGYGISIYSENGDFFAWVCTRNFGGCMPIGKLGQLRPIAVSIGVIGKTETGGASKLNIVSKETDPILNVELEITLRRQDPKSEHPSYPGEIKKFQGKQASEELDCTFSRSHPRQRGWISKSDSFSR